MGIDMRPLRLLFLLVLAALGFTGISVASPAIGLMKFSPNHGWEVYATSDKFHNKERLFVLPVGGDHAVICCAMIAGGGRKDPDEMFLSDVNSDNGTQFVYPAHLPDGVMPTDGRMAMVISAKSAKATKGGYEVINFDDHAYVVSSCFGAEGINIYIHESNRSGDHYYGYLGYAIENSSCPAQ